MLDVIFEHIHSDRKLERINLDSIVIEAKWNVQTENYLQYWRFVNVLKIRGGNINNNTL